MAQPRDPTGLQEDPFTLASGDASVGIPRAESWVSARL